MAFLTTQHLTPSGVWTMVGTAVGCRVSSVLLLTLRYSDGIIDVIPAGAVATLFPFSGTIFDRTACIWLVCTFKNSGTVFVVPEQPIPALTTLLVQDYAILARVLYTKVVDFQNV